MQVASALAYAAAQGVLHRDIKPSNLLLDGQGNVWVTDFGLAKGETDGDNLTHTGDVVGTLRYMAPERFSGRSDVRSDVYALGLTLYELLTLRPAFAEADRNQLVKQVLHDEPPRPRKLNPAVPRDLETVVLKATARDPAHRYQTPADMADDLKRFVEDRPVRARRASEAEKFARWCRRNPLPAGLLAGIVLVFLAGFVGVVWQWRGAEAARDDERGQRNRAEGLRQAADEARTRAEANEAAARVARERSDATLYFSNIARAQLEYRADNVAEAEAILSRCPAERRGWEWHFLQQLCHADLFTREGHTGWVWAVAYSPDGRLLASAGGGNPFWGVQGPASITPGEVMLWDAASGAPVRTLRGHTNQVKAVAFRPDGRWLASGSDDGTARVWDVPTGRQVRLFPGQPRPGASPAVHSIHSVAFGPDGKLLATGSGGVIDLWDLTEDRPGPPTPARTLYAGGWAWVAGLAFSPDGHRLAATPRSAWEGEVRVWDLTAGGRPVPLEWAAGVANGVAFRPDGRYLAAGGQDGILKIWDAASGRLLQSLPGHRGEVYGMAFSPDGRQLASAGADGTVRAWWIPQGTEFRLFRGHRQGGRGVAFSADGMRLASAGTDGTVKVWDLTLHPEYADVMGRELIEPEAIAFADQGTRLVIARRGGDVRTLDGDTQAPVGPTRRVGLASAWLVPGEPACLDADGRWLAGISHDDPRVACCWDAHTGQERVRLRGHTLPLWCVTLSRGGRRLATAGRPPRGQPRRLEVKVWDGTDGRPLLELDEPGVAVTRLALSPDGDRLALAAVQALPGPGAGGPRTQAVLRVYDLARRVVVRSFAGDADPYWALAFSADGTRLAVAGSERRDVLLWDLAMERPAVTHQGPEYAMDAAFSPDGRRLAVAGLRMIKLLDAATGEEVLVLRGVAHAHPDTNGFNARVRFSPDGKRLAAVCHDMRAPISLWSVADESARDPATRLRVADRRAAVAHLQAANECADDPKGRAAFLFHLKWLEKFPPGGPEDYLARGELYARDGRLEQAAPYFAEYFRPAFAEGPGRDAPGDAFAWFKYAEVLTALRDRKGYEQLCRRMLQQFRQDEGQAAHLVDHALVLAPNSALDPAEAVRRAANRVPAVAVQDEWCRHIHALALCRAGRHREAVRLLLQAMEQDARWPFVALDWYALALAYQGAGQADEARRWRDKADRWAAEAARTASRPPGWPWWNWLCLENLRREAQEKIGGTP
jgi:WD40 repeat protein